MFVCFLVSFSFAIANWGEVDKKSAYTAGVSYAASDNAYAYAAVADALTTVTVTLVFSISGENDEEPPAPLPIQYATVGSVLGTLPVPVRRGYMFGGWWSNGDYTATEYKATTIVTDQMVSSINEPTVYLQAKWSPIKYSVTYISANGATNPNAVTYYTIQNERILLYDADRDGYVFNGWYTSPTFSSSSKAIAIEKGSDGNKTFYAKWTEKNYELTFDTQGGDEVLSQTVKYDFEIGNLPVPVRLGYAFAGWWTTTSGGECYTADTIYNVARDNLLYARWTKESIVAVGIDMKDNWKFIALTSFNALLLLSLVIIIIRKKRKSLKELEEYEF
jgi:uncharacterized repeat protein (TIGR02543 family)